MYVDNQYRCSKDRFLVMAAKNRDGVKDSDKEKVDRAWKDVEKTEGDKENAGFMQHQYAHQTSSYCNPIRLHHYLSNSSFSLACL